MQAPQGAACSCVLRSCMAAAWLRGCVCSCPAWLRGCMAVFAAVLRGCVAAWLCLQLSCMAAWLRGRICSCPVWLHGYVAMFVAVLRGCEAAASCMAAAPDGMRCVRLFALCPAAHRSSTPHASPMQCPSCNPHRAAPFQRRGNYPCACSTHIFPPWGPIQPAHCNLPTQHPTLLGTRATLSARLTHATSHPCEDPCPAPLTGDLCPLLLCLPDPSVQITAVLVLGCPSAQAAPGALDKQPQPQQPELPMPCTLVDDQAPWFSVDVALAGRHRVGAMVLPDECYCRNMVRLRGSTQAQLRCIQVMQCAVGAWSSTRVQV